MRTSAATESSRPSHRTCGATVRLVRFAVGLAVAALASPSFAADDLEAARALFAEALLDQDAHRSEAALEKFTRVAAMKDTAQVEYRIATCLDDLGRIGPAARRYEAAVRLGLGDPAASDVVDAARARISTLAPKVTRLTVLVRGESASAAEILLDEEERLVQDERSAQTFVEPGDHIVLARAPGAAPARATFAATEGAKIEIVLSLAPAVAAPLPIAPPQVPVKAPPPESNPGVPVRETTSLRRPLAIGSFVAAGLFTGAATTLAVVRARDIDTLREACPSGVCPSSRRAELTTVHDRASAFGPAALASAGVAMALASAGTWLLLTSRGTALRVAPTASGLECGVHGSF